MVKVSVIIPTFNAEKTIERAIKSVVNQDFNDFEIIVCDDCSTDGTVSKLKEMKKVIPNFKLYVNKENKKSAFTRNVAIFNSIGEYIMQLDADDYCSYDRMKKQVEFLDNHLDVDFVGSKGFVFNDKGVYGEISPVERPKKKDFLKTSPFLSPSVMFRSDSLKKVNGYRVSKETSRSQDYDLFMRMYINNMIGYNIQEKLVYYYKDNDYFKKLQFKNRLAESKIRYKNFKNLGLLPNNIIYVFKPLIAAFIPNKLLNWNQNRRLNIKK